MKRHILIGEKFGMWTVLSFVGNRKWRCVCTCGRESDVQTSSLLAGRSTKCRVCGWKLHKTLHNVTKVVNDTYNSYKFNAKRKGTEWALDRGTVRLLGMLPCIYCGCTTGRMGIDRVDNSKGYVSTNSAPCCRVCNYMKCSMPFDFFLSHLAKMSSCVKELYV